MPSKNNCFITQNPNAREASGLDGEVLNSLSGDDQPITMIHSVSLGREPVVGGIESWISDFLNFSSGHYRLLGAFFDNRGEIDAEWLPKEVEAFSIARLPRQRIAVPHNLRMAAGIFRNRSLLTSRIVIHRPELAPLIRLLRPKARITLIIHTNLKAQHGSGSDSLWRFFGGIYYLFETFFFKFANQVIAHTVKDAPRLRHKVPGLAVVAGWYNDGRFKVTVPAKDRSGVIWVGRFERVKDPLLAVKAFGTSRSEAKTHLTLVGSGSLAADILQEVQQDNSGDAVSLLPPMSATELSELLNQHRLLLHTSHFEGSPRVILEAMACGLVVVTLPECDPDGWVEKTGAGIYAPDRTPEAVGAALLAAPILEPSRVAELIQSRSAREVIPLIEKIITGD